MVKPKVYVDFQNADPRGRVRLTCIGTIQDLSRQQIQLREGLVLTLYTDDADDQGQPDELRVEGIVAYSEEEGSWVATIDWDAIWHASEEGEQEVNGAPMQAQKENRSA